MLVSSFLIYFIFTAIHLPFYNLFSSACMSTILFCIPFILPITPFYPPNHSFLFIIESEQPFHLDSYWTFCSLLSFSQSTRTFFLTFLFTLDFCCRVWDGFFFSFSFCSIADPHSRNRIPSFRSDFDFPPLGSLSLFSCL